MQRWVAALVTVALAGCASYRAQPVDLTKQADQLQARRLDDAGLARYAASLGVSPWPPPRWTRADLLLVALYFSPAIAEARARLLAARAAQVTAREYPNPQLTLAAEYAVDAGIAPWLYGALLRALLPQTDLRRAQRLQARFYTQAAGWRLAETVWSVRRRVRRALLEWHYADAAETTLAREAADAETLAGLLQAQVRAGQAEAPSALAAQARALNIRQQRRAMAATASAARHTLAAALALPTAALPALRPVWSHWRHPEPVSAARVDRWRRRALLTRADLARALADYDAAEQALRIEVDRQYPGVEVEPGYVWDHGVRKLPLSVRFSLPIFNQNQGPIAQALARRRLAGARLLAVQARILAQIATALDGVRRAEAIAGGFHRRQLPLAERTLRAAQQRFRLGESERIALLAARIDAEQIQLAALSADFRRQQARGALEDALHHPLDDAEIALIPQSHPNPPAEPSP